MSYSWVFPENVEHAISCLKQFSSTDVKKEQQLMINHCKYPIVTFDLYLGVKVTQKDYFMLQQILLT